MFVSVLRRGACSICVFFLLTCLAAVGSTVLRLSRLHAACGSSPERRHVSAGAVFFSVLTVLLATPLLFCFFLQAAAFAEGRGGRRMREDTSTAAPDGRTGVCYVCTVTVPAKPVTPIRSLL